MKKKDLIFYLFINALFLMLLIVFGLNDETKDDYLVQQCLLNVNGISYKYHPFMSIIFTSFVSVVQRIVPWLAWLYISQLLVLLVSINIICTKIYRTFELVSSYILAFFVTTTIFIYCVNTFNFTRTAIVAFAGGIVCLFGDKFRTNILGICMVVISATIRFNVIYVGVGGTSIFGLYYLKFNYNRNNIKSIIRKGMFLMGAFATAFVVNKVSIYIVNSNPTWESIRDYNIVAAELRDYSMKEYSSNVNEYNMMNLSDEDIYMLQTGLAVSDPEIYNYSKMSEIADEFGGRWEREINITDICGMFTHYNDSILQMPGLVLVFICLVLFILVEKKAYVFVFLNILCIYGYGLLFEVMGRVQTRVTFGVMLMACLSMLLYITSSYNGKLEKWKIGKILSTAIVAVYLLSCLHMREVDSGMIDALEYMNENDQNFFVYQGGVITPHTCIANLLIPKDYYNMQNNYYLTQYANHPIEKFKLEKYRINNIYEACIDSDYIRFVNISDELVNYMEKYYCESAQAIPEKQIGDFTIYKIVSEGGR